MSSRDQMTQRCAFERDMTAGESDEFDFQPYLDGIPCRLSTIAGREATDSDHAVVVQDLRLRVRKGTAVVVTDRVRGVWDRLGNVVDDRALGIAAVLGKQDHVELLLDVRSW